MRHLRTKIAMIAVLAAVAGYGVYANQKQEVTLSDTALANVEALASGEQPDVSKCKYSPDSYCEALHPTDPSQDVSMANRRW